MDNNNKPLLYSKTTIILFSIIASFISGIMYTANLRALGKKKFIVPMTLYAIFASTICINALEYAGIPLIYSYIPVNLIYGFLLTNVFWNFQIELTEYRKRSALYPFLITMGIIIALMVISFIFNKKQKNRNRSVVKELSFISTPLNLG